MAKKANTEEKKNSEEVENQEVKETSEKEPTNKETPEEEILEKEVEKVEPKEVIVTAEEVKVPKIVMGAAKVIDEKPSVKMVSIHTVEDVDCYIGGNHIKITKDKDAKVPSDVAAILNNAKLAYRI